MSFIEQIRTYLTRLRERLDRPMRPAPQEVARLRQQLAERFEDIQRSGNGQDAGRAASEFRRWNDDLEDLAFEIAWGLVDLPIAEGEREAAFRLALDDALRHEIGWLLGLLGRLLGSPLPIWHSSLDEVARNAGHQVRHARWWQRRRTVMRYAAELRLTEETPGNTQVTPMGEVLLRLRGPDAIRWLLALEVILSLGPDDPWRMSRADAAALAKVGWIPGFADALPWSMRLLERCVCMHLLEEQEEEDEGGPSQSIYTTTALGATLLQEAATQDTPFILLARALAADHTQAILSPPSGHSPDTAAEASMRHTRMVAHEIRNALVPVRVALDRLWSTLRHRDLDDLLGEPRGAIDTGIDRVFRFLSDAERITRIAPTPREDFELMPALREAVAALDLPPRQPIEPEVAPEAAGLLLHGHRERFVLAVINLLRNAVQVGGVEVVILIHVELPPGARRLRLAIDDDGPGIAPEHRDSVFQNGVSHRTHGTGHGLSLVREIIEGEMSGRLAYEDSPRGGARFLMELPFVR